MLKILRNTYILKLIFWAGVWVAQSVDHPTLAQVMFSWSGGSSSQSGSVLTAQSLEPALNSVSPSLSTPPLFVLSLKNKNK